jgi:protein-L-isoaspartate(D-aspartate) O-methyltransferase
MEQTISQPYIVAVMLEALSLKPEDRVLEVGTGSGYVTALLCQLVEYAYSVERHQALAEQAERRLADLGFRNATIVVGDGARGLPDFSPYDAILISAAATSFPVALFSQLREGGRMIAPIGPPDTQELQLITKREGAPSIRHLDPCRFVPLISDATEQTQD